jgi:hypothetical protein
MGTRFSDINNHWSQACILALAERKLISGYPDGTFKPDGSITRAEFAVLMSKVFPNAQPVRPAAAFADVPNTYWAYQPISWSYERGFFSGYPDGKFQPVQPIPRMQAIIVLATALGLKPTATTEATLKTYFNDAEQIPDWTRWAIAAATESDRLMVNYPEVRLFRPTQSITRGELAAMLCRALGISAVPPQYATWYTGIYDINASENGSLAVPFARWKGSGRLMHDIQTLLTPFRLFPPGEWISGNYDWQTEQALTRFCDFYGLNTMKLGVFDQPFAWALINADPVEFIMAQSKDRQQVFNTYLQQEVGYNADSLAFLDRGYLSSAYAPDVGLFPERMLQKPDGQTTTSTGQTATQTGTNLTVSFKPYPALGVIPVIDAAALNFLHPSILQACVCIGSFVNGEIWTRWLGKNALSPAQMWSTTKIIPLLHVAAKANAAVPPVNVRDCLVCARDSTDGYGFYNLSVDLVSYRSLIASSNSVAAMFKQFSTPAELEGWLQQITGNTGLEFQGRYGEDPLLTAPSLLHQPTSQVVLNSPDTIHLGNNAISSYDLTRMVSLLGWHGHLSAAARIPNAQWSSLETIVRAMGTDTARYIDLAIETLGLASAIEAPVIISKLGFGRSEIRNRTELGYVAYFQFVDQRPRAKGKPGMLRTVSLALLGAQTGGDPNEEARQLDARIAAEVTEIVRQVVTQELV